MKTFSTSIRTFAVAIMAITAGVGNLRSSPQNQSVHEVTRLDNVTSNGCTFIAQTLDSPFPLGTNVKATFVQGIQAVSCRTGSSIDISTLGGRRVELKGTQIDSATIMITEVLTVDDCPSRYFMNGVFRSLSDEGFVVQINGTDNMISFPDDGSGNHGDTTLSTIRSCEWEQVYWSSLYAGDAVAVTLNTYDFPAANFAKELIELNTSTFCPFNDANPMPEIQRDRATIAWISNDSIALNTMWNGQITVKRDARVSIQQSSSDAMPAEVLEPGTQVIAYMHLLDGRWSLRSIKLDDAPARIAELMVTVMEASGTSLTVRTPGGNIRTLKVEAGSVLSDCSGVELSAISGLAGRQVLLHYTIDGNEAHFISASEREHCLTPDMYSSEVVGISPTEISIKALDDNSAGIVTIPLSSRTVCLDVQRQPTAFTSLHVGDNICMAYDTIPNGAIAANVMQGNGCIMVFPVMSSIHFTGTVTSRSTTELTVRCASGTYTLPLQPTTLYVGTARNTLNTGDNVDILSYTKIGNVICVADAVVKMASAPTDVHDMADASITCWPNPVTGTLHIDGMAAGSTLRLVSIDGSIALSTTTASAIDVSHVSTGMYTLVVTDPHGMMTRNRVLVLH